MSDMELAEEIERYLAPDAIYYQWMPSMADMEQIIAALRRRELSLAQTEIKGHMRVEDELRAEVERERMHVVGCSVAALGNWKEGDSLHADYDCVAIRDVAKLRVKYDEAQARIAELEKDAARYQTKKHIDCLKFMETSGYKICKDTDSLLIAWSMSYDAAIDAALKDRA